MSQLCLRSSSAIAAEFAPRSNQDNQRRQQQKSKGGGLDRRNHRRLAVALDATTAATSSATSSAHGGARNGGAYRPLIAARKFAKKRGRSMSIQTSALCSATAVSRRSAIVCPRVSSPCSSTSTNIRSVLARLGSSATATASGSCRPQPAMPGYILL